MKFAEEIFPKGTFKHQKSDGAYINITKASNLDVYAEKIVEDMHFLLLITGNDSVGNGKSTEATQVGTYLTWKINNLHNLKNTFTSNNMVFKAKELISRSFELPKYSVIVLDEGDDLTTHGMKQAAVELKRYFRKCRQLNQILILILPSFFELPKFYALARSHCLINVKFMERFNRGYFDFYGPHAKKLLYLKGKKEWDYTVRKPDFDGRFFSSYCFFPDVKGETAKYLELKHQDTLEDTHEQGRVITSREIRADQDKKIIERLIKYDPKIKTKVLSLLFLKSTRRIQEIKKEIEENSLEKEYTEGQKVKDYSINTSSNDVTDQYRQTEETIIEGGGTN